jgi:beta-phosphoglucomutase-like phosphatase (HAD superfamily)
MTVSARRRGVVFDLDGVLVMTEHLWEEAWQFYAAQRGYAWTADDTRACQGMSVTEWATYVAVRTSGTSAAAARDVIDRVNMSYAAGRVSLALGAENLVAAVAARVPIGLASSAPREIIDTVMETMGIGRYFSVTVSSAEVSRGKPSPDVYREAIQRLGVDPSGSLAVEDSSNGVRAAAAAGLAVIAVVHEPYPLAPDAAALVAKVHHSLAGVKGEIMRILDRPMPGDQRP